MGLEHELDKRLAEAGQRYDQEAREAAPRKERVEALRQSGPRLVFRDPPRYGGHPHYRPIRLHDLHWVAAHTEEFQRMRLDTFKLTPKQKRRVPDTVRLERPSHLMHASRLDEYVRRPSARHLRRIEAAEKAVADAQAELKLALRAAFTSGKPVTASAVKAATREHKKTWDGETS